MPFWRTYYHLVWATKKRAHLITPELEPRLYGYLVSKAREIGVHVYALDGWYDHIHMIVSIPPKLAVAEVVKRLKGASAYDLNHGDRQANWFGWQRGYGVLTIGQQQRASAEEYVRRQKEHHRQQTANRWLERIDQFDDGPEDTGLESATLPPMVQEKQAAYHVTADPQEFPF